MVRDQEMDLANVAHTARLEAIAECAKIAGAWMLVSEQEIRWHRKQQSHEWFEHKMAERIEREIQSLAEA